MTIFDQAYKFLAWNNKVMGAPPSIGDTEGISHAGTWSESNFPSAMSFLRKARGETKGYYHTLYLYEEDGVKKITVHKHKKESEKESTQPRAVGVSREDMGME